MKPDRGAMITVREEMLPRKERLGTGLSLHDERHLFR